MIAEDKTEAALLAEFGTYLTALAKTFSKPLQTSLEDAERKMLLRIGEQRDAADIADQSARKALSTLHTATHEQLKAFGREIQSLRELVTSTQRDLTQSRVNFETELITQLKATLLCELKPVRAQMEAVATRQKTSQRLIYCLVALALLLLVVAAFVAFRVLTPR
jgi:hypothetical protein